MITNRIYYGYRKTKNQWWPLITLIQLAVIEILILN